MSTTDNHFSEVEDKLLRQLLADGLKPCAVASRMGRPQSSVYSRIQSLGLGPGQQPKTKRNCMCCRKEFLSEGPHNRLCTTCRAISRGPFDR